MSIKPPERHSEREAGRTAAQGRRTDNGSGSILVVVHETTDRGPFTASTHPDVRISKSDAVEIAQGICWASR